MEEWSWRFRSDDENKRIHRLHSAISTRKSIVFVKTGKIGNTGATGGMGHALLSVYLKTPDWCIPADWLSLNIESLTDH